MDENDRPVAEATVELWGPGGRLASTSSSESGAFILTSPAGPPLAVLARKIGFLPSRIAVTDAQPLVVRLRARGQVLAELTVTTTTLRCVSRDNGAGRRLWLAVRARYAPPPLVAVNYPGGGTQMVFGLRGQGRTHTGLVNPESLGILDTSALREQSMWRLGMTALLYARYGPARFYAVSYSGMTGGRFDRYQYPYLDSFEAFHFADSLFGAWNAIGEPVREGGSIVLEFCSRHDRNQPFLAGTITLTADSTLASARYRFVTADEIAGGEVWFAPRSPDELLPPLAAIGLYWRRRLRDVFQQWTLYDQWFVCPVADAECRDRRPIGEFVR